MARIVTLLFVLVSLCSGPLHAEAIPHHPILDALSLRQGERPFLIGAHRGGRAEFPENTLTAYQEAIKAYPAILLEGDVQMTRDGQAVMLHDATVDRTTDGAGPVSGFELAALQKLDAAYHFSLDQGRSYPWRGKGVCVPLLSAVLAATPNHLILVELKGGDGLVEEVIRVVRAAGAEQRFIAASFKPGLMKAFRQAAPEIATCFDIAEALRLLRALHSPAWLAYTPRAQVLSFSPDLVERFSLEAADFEQVRAKGIHVQVHTLNQRSEVEHWRGIGVDSILTDCPGKLFAWVSE